MNWKFAVIFTARASLSDKPFVKWVSFNQLKNNGLVLNITEEHNLFLNEKQSKIGDSKNSEQVLDFL
ncbi:hypothetical protein P3G55_14920 [Leptospira sp. 96542]|nr:hypothetical protein [Leptospira sp. 96542]